MISASAVSPPNASAGDPSNPGRRSTCLLSQLSCEARSSLRAVELRYQELFCFVSPLLPLGARCQKPFSWQSSGGGELRAVPGRLFAELPRVCT